MHEQRQEDMIRMHLEDFGSISSWDAIQKYHITRLAEMIRRLRAKGYEIESHWLRNGQKRFVRYYLSGDRNIENLTEKELVAV
jgi:hypothetical protein